MKIYHYPKCKKSRSGLDQLRRSGIEPEVINYVEEGIEVSALQDLFTMLGVKPSQMVRRQEIYYQEELAHLALSDEEWLKVISENPRLLKRPVITDGKRAVLGDPVENIIQFLNDNTHEDKN